MTYSRGVNKNRHTEIPILRIDAPCDPFGFNWKSRRRRSATTRSYTMARIGARSLSIAREINLGCLPAAFVGGRSIESQVIRGTETIEVAII